MNDRIHKATWFDLFAADVVDAMSFYEGLFGWKFLRMKEPVLTDYWVIQCGEETIGGLRQVENHREGGAVIYFTVASLDAAVQRARDLGAKPVGETVNLGEGRGRYQWIKDRANNIVALWAEK